VPVREILSGPRGNSAHGGGGVGLKRRFEGLRGKRQAGELCRRRSGGDMLAAGFARMVFSCDFTHVECEA